MRKRLLVILILGAWAAALPAQIKRNFNLPKELSEASGLAIIAPDTLVWHNDSGNDPVLYFTNGRGDLIKTLSFPELPPTDWEDLARSSAGDLYIGNFGNNCHCRDDLAIYILSDSGIDSINFVLPDQKAFPLGEAWRNFDLEAMIWFQDSLHLFSKNLGRNKGTHYAKHYVLPAQPGQYVAELRDSVKLKNRFVSAAAISPDQQMVALLSLRYDRLLGFIPYTKSSVFTFTGFSGSNFVAGAMKKKSVRPHLFALQYEALDFADRETLVVGCEKTWFIKARGKRISLGKKHFE
jgi:hypothetical protein